MPVTKKKQRYFDVNKCCKVKKMLSFTKNNIYISLANYFISYFLAPRLMHETMIYQILSFLSGL